MNKLIKGLCVAILFSSCASVKLLDSWKSDDFSALKNQKILVAAKSPDAQIQKSYENAIVKHLKNQGIDALSIHETFPDFEEKERTTEEEKNKVVQLFKEKGIVGVIVTSLKSTIETSDVASSSVIDVPGAYKNRSFITFNTGDDVHALPKLDAIDSEGPLAAELKSTTYILEAVTYDLSLETDKQLTNVTLIEVTDPGSASRVLNRFSKIVSDQFK